MRGSFFKGFKLGAKVQIFGYGLLTFGCCLLQLGDATDWNAYGYKKNHKYKYLKKEHCRFADQKLQHSRSQIHFLTRSDNLDNILTKGNRYLCDGGGS